MPVLNDICNERLYESEKASKKRSLVPVAVDADGVHILREGIRYLNFSGNDYLGLSHHPKVKEAASDALKTYGAGAGASRLVTGNHPLYTRLESQLARYKHTESALVFGSGMLANMGVLSGLMSEGDIIIADKLSHASMLDGAALSGATLKRFLHNDMAHLETVLRSHRAAHRHCLIMSESVFSMDGDKAPIEALSLLAKRYDAWLMIDDAHGLGITGPINGAVDIWVGTLSKALGSYGGYIAGSASLIAYLTSHARALMYTTGLPPATIAAATAALDILENEPERQKTVLKNAAHICHALALPMAQSAIVPWVIGQSEDALNASGQLAKKGIWVQAIRPPTVPQGSARLRMTCSALHTDTHIAVLIDALQNIRIVS